MTSSRPQAQALIELWRKKAEYFRDTVADTGLWRGKASTYSACADDLEAILVPSSSPEKAAKENSDAYQESATNDGGTGNNCSRDHRPDVSIAADIQVVTSAAVASSSGQEKEKEMEYVKRRLADIAAVLHAAFLSHDKSRDDLCFLYCLATKNNYCDLGSHVHLFAESAGVPPPPQPPDKGPKV